LGCWDVPAEKVRKEIGMKTYSATVDARVLRAVIVEADTEEQALIAAHAEVMAQLGAYSVEVREMEEV